MGLGWWRQKPAGPSTSRDTLNAPEWLRARDAPCEAQGSCQVMTLLLLSALNPWTRETPGGSRCAWAGRPCPGALDRRGWSRSTSLGSLGCHPGEAVLLEDSGFLPSAPGCHQRAQTPAKARLERCGRCSQPCSQHRVGAQPAGGGCACSPALAASEPSQLPQGTQGLSLSSLCTWDSGLRAGPGRQEPPWGVGLCLLGSLAVGTRAESRVRRVCLCVCTCVCMCARVCEHPLVCRNPCIEA